MQNGLLKVGWADLLDGIVTAIFVAVVIALAGVVQQPGFDVFTANWGQILQSMFNFGFIALIGSLAKSAATTNDGKLLGVVTTN